MHRYYGLIKSYMVAGATVAVWHVSNRDRSAVLYLNWSDGRRFVCAPIRSHMGTRVTRATVLKHEEEIFGFALFVMLS